MSGDAHHKNNDKGNSISSLFNILRHLQKVNPHLHQFSPDWLDVIIKEIRLEIVNTKLQCPQTLENKYA